LVSKEKKMATGIGGQSVLALTEDATGTLTTFDPQVSRITIYNDGGTNEVYALANVDALSDLTTAVTAVDGCVQILKSTSFEFPATPYNTPSYKNVATACTGAETTAIRIIAT